MSEAIELVLKISGQDKVVAAFRETGVAGEKAGKAVEAGAKIGEHALDELARDALKLGTKMEEAAGKVDHVGTALRQVKGDAFAQAASDADKFNKTLDESNSRFDGLNAKAEKWRNVGAGIAAASAGGIALAHSWSAAAKEGDEIEARMEGILKSQGRFKETDKINSIIQDVTVKMHLPDDDPAREAVVQMLGDEVKSSDISPLLEAAVRNAHSVGISIEQAGTLFAKAYGTGNLAMLRRANILFSDQEQETVKAAYGISQAAGQAALMDATMAATNRTTGQFGDGMTDVQKKSNDAARAYDDFATTMGRGSRQAEASIQTLGVRMLSVISTNESFGEKAGAAWTWVSYIGAGVGSVVGFVAQLAIMKNALDAAKVARVASTIANEADTVATGINAGAQKGLAIAEGEAAIAADIEAGSITAAGNASVVAGEKAAIAKGGFAGLTKQLGLLAIAAYGIDKAWGGIKDRGMGDDALKQKYGAWGDWWVWASGSSRANAETGDNMDGGAGKEMDPAAQAKADTEKMIAQATGSIGAATSSVIPAAGALAGVPSGTATPGAATGAGAGNVKATDKDPYASQLRDLRRQKSHLKGKANAAERDALQAQIEGLQDQQTIWKTAHSQAVTDARENTKEAKEAKRKADHDSKVRASLESLKAGFALDDKITELEASKESATEAQKRSIDYQIDKLKAEEARAADNERIAGMPAEDVLAKDVESQKSQLKYEHALAVAERKRDRPETGAGRKNTFESIIASWRAKGSGLLGGDSAGGSPWAAGAATAARLAGMGGPKPDTSNDFVTRGTPGSTVFAGFGASDFAFNYEHFRAPGAQFKAPVSGSSTVKARVGSITQRANSTTVQFEPLEIPRDDAGTLSSEGY